MLARMWQVEVMEASYSLDNTRRSGYDPDELEEEQHVENGHLGRAAARHHGLLRG